jgi:hypothetical protein
MYIHTLVAHTYTHTRAREPTLRKEESIHISHTHTQNSPPSTSTYRSKALLSLHLTTTYTPTHPRTHTHTHTKQQIMIPRGYNVNHLDILIRCSHMVPGVYPRVWWRLRMLGLHLYYRVMYGECSTHVCVCVCFYDSPSFLPSFTLSLPCLHCILV